MDLAIPPESLPFVGGTAPRDSGEDTKLCRAMEVFTSEEIGTSEEKVTRQISSQFIGDKGIISTALSVTTLANSLRLKAGHNHRITEQFGLEGTLLITMFELEHLWKCQMD